MSFVTLNMFVNLNKPILAMMLASLLAGCGRMTTSGIPKALDTDALIIAAQGISLRTNGEDVFSDSRHVATKRRFSAKISSGTSGQLLAAYRQKVMETIISTGAELQRASIWGFPDDVREFSYSYTWGRTEGIVSVDSFSGTNGQVQIVSFCYEHSR